MKNGRHISGRLLAALLCVVMIATMIPAFASAASKPKAPKMSKVSCVETGVKVVWNSVSGATGYRVFRKEGSKGSWKAIAETTDTKYTDKKASSGKTYYYAVRSLKGDKVSDLSKNSKNITYYKTPEMKSVTVQTDGILVKWKKSAGAVLYRVYRSTDGGSWEKVGTSKTTSYLDKKVKYGKEYKYYVRVVDKNNKNTLSSYDHTPVGTIFTKKAEIKSLTNQDQKIRVKWNTVKGASQYRLFRKIGDGDWFTKTTTSSTNFTDTDVKNNLTYTYYIRALDASGNYIGTYHPGKSITYFSTPQTKDCVRSGSNLVVTWDPVEGVSNYAIYRKISTGEWIKVGTSSGTSYSDSSMPSGTYCEYTVACADASGEPISAYGVNTVGTESFKAIPILLSVKNVDGGVTVTWQAVDKAQKYKVYRKIGDNTAKFTQVKTLTGTTWTDTNVSNCKKYTYTVCVCDSSDNDESMYNTTGLSITYYDPPTISTVKNTADGVEITWDKLDGVPNYKIWRKTGNGTWTVLTTVNGANVNYVYVDKNVVNNGHYNYTISAVANSESGYKDPGKDTTFYAAPAINSVTTNDGSITISWGVVETVTGYRVQRKVDGGTWTDVVSSQTARTYTDTSVTSGKKYTYRICSLVSGAKVSGYRTTESRIYLSKPIITSVSAGKGQVTIKWDQAVVGANSYDVYYMAYPGGSWKKAVSAAPIDKSCVVKGLTSGQTYSFKLVAVNGSSRSVDSATKNATAK